MRRVRNSRSSGSAGVRWRRGRYPDNSLCAGSAGLRLQGQRVSIFAERPHVDYGNSTDGVWNGRAEAEVPAEADQRRVDWLALHDGADVGLGRLQFAYARGTQGRSLRHQRNQDLHYKYDSRRPVHRICERRCFERGQRGYRISDREGASGSGRWQEVAQDGIAHFANVGSGAGGLRSFRRLHSGERRKRAGDLSRIPWSGSGPASWRVILG